MPGGMPLRVCLAARIRPGAGSADAGWEPPAAQCVRRWKTVGAHPFPAGLMLAGCRSGFTLAEVPVTVVVLVVGVLALVGSFAAVSRMNGQGRHATALASAAGARMDWLRGLASGTSPACLDPGFAAGETVTGRITERWTVPPAGALREITLALRYPEHGGTAWDTVRTVILCR
jgi:hypothetical protein